jgi:hypothetical protein
MEQYIIEMPLHIVQVGDKKREPQKKCTGGTYLQSAMFITSVHCFEQQQL